MASAVLSRTNGAQLSRIADQVGDRHGWGFTLLLATTATLFLRPADLIPSLDQWPIYQVLILSCAVVSAPSLVRQFSHWKLVHRPVTTCMLWLLLAIGASHLSHGFVWGARSSMFEFGKLMLLYGLIVGLINTPRRLSMFIKWLIIAITFTASLAILDHFEFVSIAAIESVQDRGIEENGVIEKVDRIRGTGIFQDPNDFGLILVTGSILCISNLFRPGAGVLWYLWLIPTSILLGALILTKSRGGLLSFISAMPAAVLFFRNSKYAVLPLIGLPIIALAFSSRMTDVNSISQGTGQSRLQIWSESLQVFQQYPLFGLGEGMIADEMGVVTHNSFLHCYAELGLLGGAAFFSCFVAAGWSLWSLRPNARHKSYLASEPTGLVTVVGEVDDQNATSLLAYQCGFLFAVLVACGVAMLTLSRQLVAPTYLIVGLASAGYSLAAEHFSKLGLTGPRLGNRFLLVVGIANVMLMLAIYLTVRIFVSW